MHELKVPSKEPDVSAVRTILTRSLVLASRRWKAMADEIMKARDLSHATALVLIVIDSLDCAATQSGLAREIGIEGPTLVRLLDQLERQGRIERHENPNDRRAKVIRLSAAGKALAADIQKELETLRTAALGDVSKADLEAALRVLSAIRSAEAPSNGEHAETSGGAR